MRLEHLIDTVVHLRTGRNSIYSNWIEADDLKHTLGSTINHIEARYRMNEIINKKKYKEALTMVPKPSNTTQQLTREKELQEIQEAPTLLKNIDRFKQALESAEDKTKVVLKWLQKSNSGCALYSNQQTTNY